MCGVFTDYFRCVFVPVSLITRLFVRPLSRDPCARLHRIQEQLRRIKRNEEKERVRAERRRIKQEAKELNPNLAKVGNNSGLYSTAVMT